MKIVHVVYSLDMGGAEVLVAQLCRLQKAQGHEVSVCAYSQLGVLGSALVAEGMSIQVMGAAHPLVSMLRYFRLFRKTRPDVVHCHNIAPTIQAAFSARLAGVRKVLTTRHGTQLPYDVAEERKYSLAYRSCDWVIGICEAACNDLRGAPLAQKNKIRRVYNGTVPAQRVDIQHLGKRGFTLVAVGRLAVVKDLGTLIRALAIALKTVPGIDLWLVGDGPTRPELEALVAELGLGDHVRFWGQQTRTAPFFSAADVFVMSSLAEGLPMSLLESMSLGLPSILTDVGGMGEMIHLSHAGLAVPRQEPPAYAEAILKLAADPDLRALFAARARATFEEQFTLDHMNAQYMEIYTE